MMGYVERLKHERTWYNVELTQEKAEDLKIYLRNHNIYFEPSEAYNLIHIECLLNDNEVDLVNEFLSRKDMN